MRDWVANKGLSSWSEGPRAQGGTTSLVLLPEEEGAVLAAHLGAGRALRVVELPLAAFPSGESLLEAHLADSPGPLLSDRLDILVREDEVQTRRTLLFQGGDRIWRVDSLDGVSSWRPAPEPAPEAVLADDLAHREHLVTNELHHPATWRPRARRHLRGLKKNASTTAVARRLTAAVHDELRYDMSIRGVKQFTCADSLVLGDFKGRGICDEFAVVLITYLRAVGIPARLVHLVWTSSRGRASHSCVEWWDDRAWQHADPTYGVFKQRSHYRDVRGVRAVKVYFADDPRDRRSSAVVEGVPDHPRDQRLNPWTDFRLTPSNGDRNKPGYCR